MARGRKLADDISSLLNSHPSSKFEEEEEADRPRIDEYDEFSNDQALATNGKLPLKAAISLDRDKKYSGKKTNRSDWEESLDKIKTSNEDVSSSDNDEEGQSNEDSDEFEEGIDPDAIEEYSDEEDEDEEDEEEQNREAKRTSAGKSKKKFNAFDAADELEEEIMGKKNSAVDDGDILLTSDLGHKNEADKAEQTEKEVRKAKHVTNQRLLWDKLLALRIKEQKVLTLGNRLPKSEVFWQFQNHSADVKTSLDEIGAETKRLIGDLFELRSALMLQNEEVKSFINQSLEENQESDRKRKSTQTLEKIVNKKRKPFEQLKPKAIWEEIQELQTAFSPYEEKVIDNWSKKIQLQSNILASHKFKSLNKSISEQVDTVMQDKERMLKRAHTRRNDQKIIGETEHSLVDKEIFDDTDFYQQILQELLDQSIPSGDGIAITMSWLQSKSQQPKKHKDVDTKASKGRKIKYVTHDKIVNFASTVEKPLPRHVDELFHRLFAD